MAEERGFEDGVEEGEEGGGWSGGDVELEGGHGDEEEPAPIAREVEIPEKSEDVLDDGVDYVVGDHAHDRAPKGIFVP